MLIRPAGHGPLRVVTEPFQPHPTVPRRIVVHTFELAIALAFLVLSASYMLDPDRTLIASPIGRELPVYLWLTWSLLEAAGAIAVIYGLLRPRPNHRVAGLILLSTGTLMHGVAALAAGIDLRDLSYLIFSAACGLRAAVATRFALEGT